MSFQILVAHARRVMIIIIPVVFSFLVLAFSADPPPIILANEVVRLEFEPETMGLAAMVDVESGVNHIQAVVGRHALWELHFARGTQVKSLSSLRTPCTSRRLETLDEGGRRATFEWTNLDWWREKGAVSVRVTVELPPHSGIASWRIRVHGRSASPSSLGSLSW